jgi:hypothetical protein
MARWMANTNEPLNLPPMTDLKRVHYNLMGGTNLTAVRGLDRVEEWLLGTAMTVGTNGTDFADRPDRATNAIPGLDGDLDTTNLVSSMRLPLTERIQFLAFRYWNGKEWVESWSGMELPGGVEIILGHEPMPKDSGEVYPYELMRRVVYLPNSIPPENQILLEPDEETVL